MSLATTSQLVASPERPMSHRMRRSAKSIIPPELTDRVIDFLHTDWDTLKSCSLVCKAWLPASRYHLWQRVILRRNSDHEKAYAEFLRSSPIVSSSIGDLTVEFEYPRRESEADEEQLWLRDTLTPIFTTLYLLRQLMFINIEFVDTHFLSTINFKLSSLHSLELSLCRFPKFTQFTDLIWSCPRLETLRLDNVTFDETDEVIPKPPSFPRAKLKFLMIIFYSSHMPTVVDWLVSEDFCSQLDFLVVFQLQVESPAVTRLLPAIGPHLQHLSVSYAFLPLHSGTKNDLFPTLSHCTDLRSLNFLFAGSGNLNWIPTVISQITSPHVEEIDLGITDVFSSEDFERFDWDALWRSLNAKKFVRLKSVRFMVAAVSDDLFSDTKECITRHLKGIDTKGLITVVENVPPQDDSSV